MRGEFTEKQLKVALWIGYLSLFSAELRQILNDIVHYTNWRDATMFISRISVLSERQNHRCAYCGKRTWVYDADNDSNPAHITRKMVIKPKRKKSRLQAMTWTSDKLPHMTEDDMATEDHIIPKARYGADIMTNLVMSCYTCNRIKGTVDALIFWDILQTSEDIITIRDKCRKLNHDYIRNWANPAMPRMLKRDFVEIRETVNPEMRHKPWLTGVRKKT